MKSITVSMCGMTGVLLYAPFSRAGRVRLPGALFQGGGAACFLVTAHHGDPGAHVLFSLS